MGERKKVGENETCWGRKRRMLGKNMKTGEDDTGWGRGRRLRNNRARKEDVWRAR